MKIYADDQLLFEISDSDFKLLNNDLLCVEEDIKRRLQWVISHKLDLCYKSLKEEWDQKLADNPDISSVPTKRDEYVNFVTGLDDYKNRTDRESDIKPS